jgi:hypothetical protein
MISARCELRLAGVHPDLMRVVRRAAEGGAMFRVPLDGGRRTPERQAELMRAGKTQTLNSRHLTGHAVDLAPHGAERRAAGRKPFLDGPHFELPEAVYPAG